MCGSRQFCGMDGWSSADMTVRPGICCERPFMDLVWRRLSDKESKCFLFDGGPYSSKAGYLLQVMPRGGHESCDCRRSKIRHYFAPHPSTLPGLFPFHGANTEASAQIVIQEEEGYPATAPGTDYMISYGYLQLNGTIPAFIHASSASSRTVMFHVIHAGHTACGN